MTVILACLLIIGGAIIASRDLWMRRVGVWLELVDGRPA